MKSDWKLHTVSADGAPSDTGKLVSLSGGESNDEIVSAVFAKYGFTQYQNYYTVDKTDPRLLKLTYSYAEGRKPTWMLEKAS